MKLGTAIGYVLFYRSPSAQTAAVVLLAGGLAVAIVGGVLYRNAEPHQWDAINIYNDGLADSTGMPRPPNAPSAAPPPPSQPPPER